MALDDKFYSQENVNVAGVRFVADQSLQNFGSVGCSITAYAASGAISVQSQTALLTKAGVDAMTLAAPVAGTQDGIVITIQSTTANAHTVTATGLFQCGTAAVNLATFPAQAGASIVLVAFNGKWVVASNNLVVFS